MTAKCLGEGAAGSQGMFQCRKEGNRLRLTFDHPRQKPQENTRRRLIETDTGAVIHFDIPAAQLRAHPP